MARLLSKGSVQRHQHVNVMYRSSKIGGMHDTNSRPDARGLFALSSEQAGYFTSAQAQAQGYSPQLLGYHADHGRFERVRRGLYRLRDYPSSPREEVMGAWLAVGKESAVVSHESALEVLGLSDVVPTTIHVLVPRARRWAHALPGVTVHTTANDLAPNDIVTRQGMRITTPLRTILDVADSGTAPEQVIMAVRQAQARGLIISARLRQEATRRDRSV